MHACMLDRSVGRWWDRQQPKGASAIGLDERSNASIEFVERLFACL
jgi:hypothetical protein